jgi:hypothetical protein
VLLRPTDITVSPLIRGALVERRGGAYTGDVTTGQLLGRNLAATLMGLAVVFAAAGTYDVSIQFKSASGSVTAKERKLWVEAVSFV